MLTATQITDLHLEYLKSGKCDPMGKNTPVYKSRAEITLALRNGEIIEPLLVAAIDKCKFGVMTQLGIYSGIGFPPMSTTEKKLISVFMSALKNLDIN